MNGLNKRIVKKRDSPYLNGVQMIQKKHMELLTDLLDYPKLGKDILDITEQKNVLQNDTVFHTELEIPYKIANKTNEKKLD